MSRNCSAKKKIKYRGHFLTKSNNLLLNEREIFKVLLQFQVNNMSHPLETKIQVVILMAKYESSFMIISE